MLAEDLLRCDTNVLILSMKMGAEEYISKALRHQRIAAATKRRQERMTSQNQQHKDQHKQAHGDETHPQAKRTGTLRERGIDHQKGRTWDFQQSAFVINH
jgi:FixJ family two-component response regulator